MTTTLDRAGAHVQRMTGRIETAVAPRSLYLSRDVLNREEIAAWARSVGLTDVQPDKFHVTVAYSRDPVNWMKVGGGDYHNIYSPHAIGGEARSGHPVGSIVIEAGGPKLVDRFDGGAIVLLFNCDTLKYRNQQISDLGGSWDYPSYQPHITLQYDPDGLIDIEAIGNYPGQIVLGPEKFDTVNENWKEENYDTAALETAKSLVWYTFRGKMNVPLDEDNRYVIGSGDSFGVSGSTVYLNNPRGGKMTKVKPVADRLRAVLQASEKTKGNMAFGRRKEAASALTQGVAAVLQPSAVARGVATAFQRNPLRTGVAAVLANVETAARKYHVLLVRDAPGRPWGVEFGDYDKKTVTDELYEMRDGGNKKSNLKIITVDGDTQAAINAAVKALNTAETSALAAEVASVLGQCEFPFTETAARDQAWWDGLTRRAQKEYLAAHPSSKYGQARVKNPRTGRDKIMPTKQQRQVNREQQAAPAPKAAGPTMPEGLSAKGKQTFDLVHRWMKDHFKANPKMTRAEKVSYGRSVLNKNPGLTANDVKSIDQSIEDAVGSKPARARFTGKGKVAAKPAAGTSVPLPTASRSAAKQRNHLVKHYGLKTLRSYRSNPYSDSQALEGTMTKAMGDKLIDDLKAQGYKKSRNSTGGKYGSYVHPDGGHISVSSSGQKNAFITVYGDKKAKRSDLPYYD